MPTWWIKSLLGWTRFYDFSEKGKLGPAGSYETWPLITIHQLAIGQVYNYGQFKCRKTIGKSFLKNLSLEDSGKKTPGTFPSKWSWLWWMETCHQFVFEKDFCHFPNSGKALRSSAILKNLGANWHLEIILNVCLLEFFGAHGFRLGEGSVEGSFNSSVHLSPSLLLGVKIAWFSTCLTHTPPLCRKREIISAIVSMETYLLTGPNPSSVMQVEFDVNRGHVCDIHPFPSAAREAPPCCRHSDLPEGGALPWPQLHMSWRPNAKGFLKLGFAADRWCFNEGGQIWIYQPCRKPPQIERMSL